MGSRLMARLTDRLRIRSPEQMSAESLKVCISCR